MVAETQTYTIDYKAAEGSERIKAGVCRTAARLITVDLHQGGMVETLTRVQSWAKGAE